jgi:hypothetical protein
MYGYPKQIIISHTCRSRNTWKTNIYAFQLLMSGQTTPSFVPSSPGITVSALEKFMGTNFKSSCTGYLSEINFNSASTRLLH